MKSIRRALISTLLLLSVFGIAGVSFAGEKASKEEAVAMVKKAVAYYKANGREKSLVVFSDQAGQFKDRELFLVVLDPKGVAVAHTALKKMIGANIMELKDVNGVMIIKSFFKAVEKTGSGWSDEYIFINPLT